MKLEDEFGDVIRKARAGLGLALDRLAAESGLTPAKLEQAEHCQWTPDERTVRKLAVALGLRPEALLDLALQRYEPAPTAFDRLGTAALLQSDFGGSLVNSYAVWDAASGEGAFFDTGVEFEVLARLQAQHGFQVRYVFLTHTHGDHIGVLEQVRRRWLPTIVGSRHELLGEAQLLDGSAQFALGMLNVEAFPTPGHTPGGLSFYVEGFGPGLPPVCVCGDTLFAGSAGRPMHSYAALLKSVREELLGLDGQTILCPGHGPLTTVAGERAHNPFA
ncbi:MAG: MBL fold metallo-hydrolase [Verrucomicrobia bacterium]|nr:MBL fold metallo-hydrolase [Verrucomicrobiota bacterium]